MINKMKNISKGVIIGILLGLILIIFSTYSYFTNPKIVDSQLYPFLLGVAAFIIGLPFFLFLISL
ncbi:hypothetical protein FJZ17_04610 [Candidatus Pacearchaeota archaeon]|nr:hypothetical protein [Candidatus Pacearchaeota archaeon]